MIADQTSVFLTAIAQGAQVRRYPTCVKIIGVFPPVFGLTTASDEAFEALLARLTSAFCGTR